VALGPQWRQDLTAAGGSVRTYDQRRISAHQQGIAVRRHLGDAIGGDIAAGAGDVFHHHRLPPDLELDKLSKKGNRPAAEIARDKKHVVTAARTVAKDVREGSINQRNIRSAIDYRAVKSSTAKGKASPLFAAFSKEVADSIHKMLVSDNTSVRLSEMVKALPHVTLEEDHVTLRRIDFAHFNTLVQAKIMALFKR
jgi:hypothetical protein